MRSAFDPENTQACAHTPTYSFGVEMSKDEQQHRLKLRNTGALFAHVKREASR